MLKTSFTVKNIGERDYSPMLYVFVNTNL
jgi:hypothetical protein